MVVTELMTGGSLADVFRGPERLSLRRGCEMALDCARGLVGVNGAIFGGMLGLGGYVIVV